MRRCGQCGSDITHRAPQARFCEDPTCHSQRMLAHGRAAYHRNREDIRQRQNAAHRARMAAKPKPMRLCAHCGKDISHRGGRARWCHLRCRDLYRHAQNPSRARHRAAARRSVPGNGLTGSQWTALVHRFGDGCAYCGARAGKLTQDHVVPISRGGHNTEGNIVPACAPCNREKADRFVAEWRHGRKGRRSTFVRTANSDKRHEYPQFASSLNLVNTTLLESG